MGALWAPLALLAPTRGPLSGVGRAPLTSPEPSDESLGLGPGFGPASLWSRGLKDPGDGQHAGAC